jgi:hypothetical protein
MTSIFNGMKTVQIREMMESVDAQAEEKLIEIMDAAIATARKTVLLSRHSADLYDEAYEISKTAYTEFEEWAAHTFTISPLKETANAWVKGSSYRFDGPKSIQNEIRQILSEKTEK